MTSPSDTPRLHGIARKVGSGYVRYPELLSSKELNPYLEHLAPAGWRFYHFEDHQAHNEKTRQWRTFSNIPVWANKTKADCWREYLLGVDTWQMPNLKWRTCNDADLRTNITMMVEDRTLEIVDAEIIYKNGKEHVSITFRTSTQHDLEFTTSSKQSAKNRARKYIKAKFTQWHATHLRVFTRQTYYMPNIQEYCVFSSCACVGHYVTIKVEGFDPIVQSNGHLAGKFIGEIVDFHWEEKPKSWIAQCWGEIMEMINDA